MWFDSFMGKPLEYWLALHVQVQERGLDEDLIVENAKLRAIVSFYEDQIRKMTEYREKIDNASKG